MRSIAGEFPSDWGDNFPAKIIPLGQPLSNRPCDAGRMNKKETFIKAVQILAPDDQIIYQAARRVSEQGLPAAPGGAALEFVVGMQRMRAPAWPCRALAEARPTRSGSTGIKRSAGAAQKAYLGAQHSSGSHSCRPRIGHSTKR